MPRKFSELRDAMPAEAQARVTRAAKAELARIAFGDHATALHKAYIPDGHAREALSATLHRLHVAIHELASLVTPKGEVTP
jgi:hypothetical protein